MRQEVNWALVVGSGILVGLLILAIITGLVLLLARPVPAAEPPERPAGMRAWWGETDDGRSFLVAGGDATFTPRPAVAPAWQGIDLVV